MFHLQIHVFPLLGACKAKQRERKKKKSLRLSDAATPRHFLTLRRPFARLRLFICVAVVVDGLSLLPACCVFLVLLSLSSAVFLFHSLAIFFPLALAALLDYATPVSLLPVVCCNTTTTTTTTAIATSARPPSVVRLSLCSPLISALAFPRFDPRCWAVFWWVW